MVALAVPYYSTDGPELQEQIWTKFFPSARCFLRKLKRVCRFTDFMEAYITQRLPKSAGVVPVASKNCYLTPLAEVTKAVKTSNSHPSVYKGTLGCELRSKAKSLAKQTFCYTSSVKNQRFLPPSPQGEGFLRSHYFISLLPIDGFFDTLTTPAGIGRRCVMRTFAPKYG